MTQSIRNFFVAFLVSFCILQQGWAQRNKADSAVFGLYVTLPFEFPHADYEQINQQLSQFGYPECRRASIIVGLGLQWHFNHGIINISYNQTSRTPKNDTADVCVQYHSFSFSYGYDLLPALEYALYPFVGFKSATTEYTYSEKPKTLPSSFTNYLQTPLDHKELSCSVPHLDLGLGFSIQHTIDKLDVRFGYLIPLDDNRWRLNNGKNGVEGAPETRYQYYLSIGLGVGAINRMFAPYRLHRRAVKEEVQFSAH
jgi:hypothetical protein